MKSAAFQPSCTRRKTRVGYNPHHRLNQVTNLAEANASTADVKKPTGKYLTFMLGGGSYAIPVPEMRESIRLPRIAAMPQMAPHIRGAINLCGNVIPVIQVIGGAALASFVTSAAATQ